MQPIDGSQTTIGRYVLVLTSVVLMSVVPGERAAAAYTNLQLTESAALQSVLCDNMTSGSEQRVWATRLECRLPSSLAIKPAGCLAKTVSGHSVSLTLTNCKTPPFASPTEGIKVPGEVFNGSVDAVFKKDAAGLHVHTSGTGVKIGNATLTVGDTTTFISAAGVQTVSVSHTSSGVDALGHAVRNTGKFTSVYKTFSACLTLNGTWKMKSGGVDSSATATNLEQCLKPDGTWGCPSGTITLTTGYRSTVASYNGSNISTVTLPNRTTENLPLTCLP